MKASAPTPGLFFTGTDTGVGKTFIGCALAAHLAIRDLRVGVAKPFESGTDASGGEPADALALARAAGALDPLDRICPFRYRRALAPGIAAWTEGEGDLDHAMEAIREIGRGKDFLLVEGAGGLLVPLARGATVLDLARAAGLPVLLVAANRLGAINHTLLTLRILAAEGLPVAGVILNRLPGPETEATRTNGPYLRSVMDAPLLGEVPPFMGPPEPALWAAHVEQHADLVALWERVAPALARRAAVKKD